MNETFYQKQIDNLEQDVKELFDRVKYLEQKLLDSNGVVVSDCADRPIYLYNHKKQT